MTVEDAIGKLVLRDMLERQQEEEDGAEGVQMMTLHASKGLEFPYVFIMGMEEEILPHRSSIEADTIEEERRSGLRGHYPRTSDPGLHLCGQAQAIRRDHRLRPEPLPR